MNLAQVFRSAEHSESIFQRPIIRISLIVSVVFIVFAIAFPTWRILPLIKGLPLVPLHANVHFGVDQSGPWWMIYTMPVMGVLILLVNTVFALRLSKRNAFLADILFVATACMSVLLFVAMIFLVLINLAYA